MLGAMGKQPHLTPIHVFLQPWKNGKNHQTTNKNANACFSRLVTSVRSRLVVCVRARRAFLSSTAYSSNILAVILLSETQRGDRWGLGLTRLATLV